MGNPNFSKTTTTDLTSGVPDYTVDSKTTDGIYSQDENKWFNENASKYYGFYYGVGEFRAAINSFSTWTVGQGYTAGSNREKVILEGIRGWGEDTFRSILWAMVCTKKFNGDAYAEIIRNEETETLINLKMLDPKRMAHISNKQGLLERYEYSEGDGKIRKIVPEKMFHLCNERILDEPHGTATTSAIEWVIEKILQAREDYARLMHVSSVRIFYVDESDTARLAILKEQYKEGIKNKEVMILTCKPEDARFQDLEVPPADAWIRWLEYLEDKLYKQLGVPKAVLGGTSDNTEASAKVGVLVYEPVWTQETIELEADVWNQLAIRIKINKQPSLLDNAQTDQAKNTGQVGFQPNDVQAGRGE